MSSNASSKGFSPRELEFFWSISESIVSGRYLKEILQLIVSMTAEITGSKICSIFLLDEQKQELAIEATQSESEDYVKKPNLKVAESVSGKALQEKRPIVVVDVMQEKAFRFPDIARKEKIVSMLSVPMITGKRAIGVVNVYTTEPHVFADSEIKLIQSVANQAAIAIENTKLREEAIAARAEVETGKLVNRAKAALMRQMNLSEDAAHQLLIRNSRNNRKTLREVAEAVLLTFSSRKSGGAQGR